MCVDSAGPHFMSGVIEHLFLVPGELSARSVSLQIVTSSANLSFRLAIRMSVHLLFSCLAQMRFTDCLANHNVELVYSVSTFCQENLDTTCSICHLLATCCRSSSVLIPCQAPWHSAPAFRCAAGVECVNKNILSRKFLFVVRQALCLCVYFNLLEKNGSVFLQPVHFKFPLLFLTFWSSRLQCQKFIKFIFDLQHVLPSYLDPLFFSPCSLDVVVVMCRSLRSCCRVSTWSGILWMELWYVIPWP